MNDLWTNRLSEYLDGELDGTERAALEAHLAACGECYATLGELRRVVARAKSLPDTSPANDLWAGIKAGITASAPVTVRRDRPERIVGRHFSVSVPQLLAASLALILMSGGSVWLALHERATSTPAPMAVRPPRIEVVLNWFEELKQRVPVK